MTSFNFVESLSLAVLFSQIAEYKKYAFGNILVSYIDNPEFHDLGAYNNLKDIVNVLSGSVNSNKKSADIEDIIKTIIKKSECANVESKDFPKRFIVFTDKIPRNMNFDNMKFNKPEIIFWDTTNTLYNNSGQYTVLSGNSYMYLKYLQNNQSNSQLIRSIIESSRYSSILV